VQNQYQAYTEYVWNYGSCACPRRGHAQIIAGVEIFEYWSGDFLYASPCCSFLDATAWAGIKGEIDNFFRFLIFYMLQHGLASKLK